MYYRLSGQLLAKGLFPLSEDAYCVLETGDGVAYQCLCPPSMLRELPPEESPCQLYTRLIVRADDHLLVGFLQRLDRDVFNLLLTASGVGVKMALNLLGGLGAQPIIAALASGDYKPLTQAKGVGPKLAQKLVLELKDKLGKWQPGEAMTFGNAETASGGLSAQAGQLSAVALQETEALLYSLGYGTEEVERSLSAVAAQRPADQLATAQTETLVRDCLTWLARQIV